MLLMIGTLFEASIDYLLKDTAEQSTEDVNGYDVSKEMTTSIIESYNLLVNNHAHTQ